MDDAGERRRLRRDRQVGAGEHRSTQHCRLRGAYLLRRELGDEIEFATILSFDSLESARAFAGDDYQSAYVPPQAREGLAPFDERSAHFKALLTRDETR